MTIDVKWSLPIVMPFVFLLALRMLFFAVGAPFPATGAAVVSAILGAIGGIFAAMAMYVVGDRLDVTIPKLWAKK